MYANNAAHAETATSVYAMLTAIYKGDGKKAIKRPNEERSKIYRALRACGFSVGNALRMCDWTYSHIKIQLKIKQKRREFTRQINGKYKH